MVQEISRVPTRQTTMRHLARPCRFGTEHPRSPQTLSEDSNWDCRVVGECSSRSNTMISAPSTRSSSTPISVFEAAPCRSIKINVGVPCSRWAAMVFGTPPPSEALSRPIGKAIRYSCRKASGAAGRFSRAQSEAGVLGRSDLGRADRYPSFRSSCRETKPLGSPHRRKAPIASRRAKSTYTKPLRRKTRLCRSLCPANGYRSSDRGASPCLRRPRQARAADALKPPTPSANCRTIWPGHELYSVSRTSTHRRIS